LHRKNIDYKAFKNMTTILLNIYVRPMFVRLILKLGYNKTFFVNFCADISLCTLGSERNSQVKSSTFIVSDGLKLSV
jgi:hypothetical protein